MANLYDGKMAALFDAMYQSFIDYDAEYEFYNQLIQGNSLLEIGSGTGNLAKRFMQNQHKYMGLDYSLDMIAIAKERNANCQFIHGDMRNFELEKPVDSIIITGRSTSYLISNEDINATLESVYTNLTTDGTLVFDFIDANRFIPYTLENPSILHQAVYEGQNYLRESHWKLTPLENFMLEWSAQYYTILNDQKEIICDDFSTVRVFTLNEIQLFLMLNGFEVINTIDRKTYAYDTYVMVCRKIDKKKS